MADELKGRWRRAPRVTDPERAQGRPAPRACAVRGCGGPTREGKPYCPAHVEQSPYVQRVLDRLARFEFERERVRQRGRRGVDLRGETAQELLRELRVNGPRSPAGLAKALGIDHWVVLVHAGALEEAGQLRRAYGEQGQELLALSQARPGPWRRWAARRRRLSSAG